MDNCYLVIVEGEERDARAFLEGLVVGAGAYGSMYFVNDLNEDPDSLIEKIKEMIHLKESHIPVIMKGHLAELVKKGLMDKSVDLDLKLLSTNRVSSARFSFQFECYSKAHGLKIEQLFTELPKGVSLSDSTKLEKKYDPEAEGVEMYSPAHPYEYLGKGRVIGPCDGVIRVYETAKEEPLIHLGDLAFDFE